MFEKLIHCWKLFRKINKLSYIKKYFLLLTVFASVFMLCQFNVFSDDEKERISFQFEDTRKKLVFYKKFESCKRRYVFFLFPRNWGGVNVGRKGEKMAGSFCFFVTMSTDHNKEISLFGNYDIYREEIDVIDNDTPLCLPAWH